MSKHPRTDKEWALSWKDTDPDVAANCMHDLACELEEDLAAAQTRFEAVCETRDALIKHQREDRAALDAARKERDALRVALEKSEAELAACRSALDIAASAMSTAMWNPDIHYVRTGGYKRDMEIIDKERGKP